MRQLSLRIFLSSILLFLSTVPVSAQQFKWVKGGGSIYDFSSDPSNEWERTEYMCTDANGNIYALSQVGPYDITADTFFMGGVSNPCNILVTSYTCNGQMRWAKLIYATGLADGCIPSGIAIDTTGHLYISGTFQTLGSSLHIGYDTVISGSSTEYLTGGLIQLDTSGHFNWIRYIGDNSPVTETGVAAGVLAMDNTNNVHHFGYLRSGVHITPTETSIGGTYDLMYNTAGSLLSSVRLDLDSEWILNGAAIDLVTNKLYVSGDINTDTYGPFTIDTFYAAAFDASRSFLWQYFTGNDTESSVISEVVLDQSKHLHFAGYVQTAIVGIPSVFSFNGMSVSDTYSPIYGMSIILTTDTNGHPQWIRHFDAAASAIDYLFSLTQLPNNKVAAAGTYAGLVTDGTSGISTPAGEGWNPFFVIVDSAGDLQTIQKIDGDGFYDGGTAITSDQAGNIYIGGQVVDSIWGTPPHIPAYYTVGGNTDFFVMKYGVDCSCTTGPIAAYTDTGTHTIGVTYTGTTTGLDSVVWVFGDAGTATGITAMHTYTLAGTYHVCATVYTTCGSDIHCSDVTILCGLPPVASFTKTGTNVLEVHYTGTTSTVDSVGWLYGDGSGDTGTTATHTYTAIGTYQVCAIAYSQCGNDTACRYDTVICVAAPVASFTDAGTITLSTAYTGTITGVDSIGWIFGDGARADGTTASHTYTAPGTYNICVVAHSSCGNDTACHTDTVLCISPPTASFTDTGRITIGATYTGTTVAIDSIVWNFGDGSGTVSGTTAIHTYSAIGIYHVCATAYNPCGNTTACKYDTVLCVSPPTASFTDTGTHTVGFVYTGTTADVDSIVWSFGDGHTATGLTAIHTYTASGTYHVCVTSYTGCGIDSSCSDVVVHIHNSGVTVLNSSDIKVYPNPANDELNITGLTEQTAYRLLTVAGTCVLRGSLLQGSSSISMHDIVPGVYVLELTGLDGARDMVRVVKE